MRLKMEEAVDWLKRAPFRETEIEIRPFMEPEDLRENLTPELRAQQERLCAEMHGER